jgi:hypothetical protein
MTRFYTDKRGRVIERATGCRLGYVKTLGNTQMGDALYTPCDQCGWQIGPPSMLKALAVLAVVRKAQPDGERVTLLDVDEAGPDG